MDVHGTMDLTHGMLRRARFAVETNFPTNPNPGEFIFKDKRVYFCVEVSEGIPLYVPMTNELDVYEFNQNTPALEWTINHNLNSAKVIVQTYDLNNKMIGADEIDCSQLNRVLIKWASPQAGFALLQVGSTVGQQKSNVAFEASFTEQTTITVNHGLGYNPITSFVVGGYEVAPDTLSYPTLNQLVATFASAVTGTVRCV